jgi:type I restriction enzyme S subunit
MATLQPYKKYNSVEYDYATELPDGWIIKKIKFLCNFQKGIAPKFTYTDCKEGFYPYLALDYLRGEKNLCFYTDKGILIDEYIPLMIWDGANAGETILSKKGFLASTLVALKPKNEITNKYLFYVLKGFEKVLKANTFGTTIPHVEGNFFKNIKIPVPPLEVQNSIVVYLDKKNSEIDKFIRNKERLVELLEEEKQSEIDKAISLGINNDKLIFGRKEIPNYPSHWQLKRTKHLFSILNGYAFSTDLFISEGVQVLKISSLYQNELSLDRQPTYVDRKYLKKLKQFVVTEGNILISLTGTLGKKDYGYAIQLKTDELYLLNQRVAKLIPKSIIDGNYALYLLRSDVFLNQLYMCPSGTKQANLCNDDILSIHIAIPGKFEQIEIANYLNASLAKFDIAISKAQKEISSIKEYREALITNLVTGKRSLNCDLE